MYPNTIALTTSAINLNKNITCGHGEVISLRDWKLRRSEDAASASSFNQNHCKILCAGPIDRAFLLAKAHLELHAVPPSRRKLMRLSKCGTETATAALKLLSNAFGSVEEHPRIAFTVRSTSTKEERDLFLKTASNAACPFSEKFQPDVELVTRHLFAKHPWSIFLLSGTVDANSEESYLAVASQAHNVQQELVAEISSWLGIERPEFVFVWEIGDQNRLLHWGMFLHVPFNRRDRLSSNKLREIWNSALLNVEKETGLSTFLMKDGSLLKPESMDAYIGDKPWEFRPQYRWTYLAKNTEKNPRPLSLTKGKIQPPSSWGCISPSLVPLGRRCVSVNARAQLQAATAVFLLKHGRTSEGGGNGNGNGNGTTSMCERSL